ncbi:HAAS signaling domain-containing protein [Paenibacillus aceti]|nr:DUF1700 domain-containing protein [Paenibacillus aceti]
MEKLLQSIPQAERNDILYDYREHFEAGKLAGKSEAEIIDKLGSPALIARELLLDYSITAAENEKNLPNIVRAVGQMAGLNLINAIFIALPALVLLILLASLIIVTAALILSPLLIIVNILQQGFNLFFFYLFATMTLCSLGILLGVGVKSLSNRFYNVTLRLLRSKLGMQRSAVI